VVGKTHVSNTRDTSQATASDSVPCPSRAVSVFGRRPRWPIDGSVPVEDHNIALRRQELREGTKRLIVDFVEHVKREDAVVGSPRLRIFPTRGAEVFEAQVRRPAANDVEHFGLHVVTDDVKVGASLGKRKSITPRPGAEIEHSRAGGSAQQLDERGGRKPAFAFGIVEHAGALVGKYVRLFSPAQAVPGCYCTTIVNGPALCLFIETPPANRSQNL